MPAETKPRRISACKARAGAPWTGGAPRVRVVAALAGPNPHARRGSSTGRGRGLSPAASAKVRANDHAPAGDRAPPTAAPPPRSVSSSGGCAPACPAKERPGER
ncbi:uncharacterized protein Tco025E_08035, partial [Trypanosoma conorhini]